jgi:flagellar hook-associated protein 2
LLSGQTGSNGVFTLTSSPDLGFHDAANTLQSAQDSIIGYEGLSITRDSNSITDVIDGVTVNLMGASSSNIRVDITNDKSTLKSTVQEVVNNYNNFLTLLDEFTTSDDNSTADMAGALTEDTSLIRFLKNKVKDAVFADSSTPSGSITALRDLGLSVNQYGDITLDEAVFDTVVLSNYDDTVAMLTADTSNENLFSDTKKGLAQDIATTLSNFTDSDGIVTNREAGAKTDLTGHQDELLKLEARMEIVYNRYLAQFGAMETMMARLDSTKDYLTSQFETLAKAYDDP